MTIPTQMNCPHSGSGWCLECVGRLDTEIAGLRLLIRGEQTKPPFDVADDQTTEMAVEIAALTADLAARGETIVRLEGEVERLKHAKEMWPAVYSCQNCDALEKQLIEERWQKDRAEWQRDHRCGFEYVEGIAVAQSCDDDRHAYTPDDWRRDARETWEKERK